MGALLDQLAAELGTTPTALASAIQGGGESEALTPTYLTVNPDGSIGALFTGGIQIPLAQGTNTPTQAPRARKVAFVTSNGVEGAEVAAVDNTTTHPLPTVETFQAWLQAARPPAGGAAQQAAEVDLVLVDANGTITDQLVLRDNPTSNPTTQLRALLGAAAVTILDSNQGSGFLQLLSTQKLRFTGGISNFTWPGASQKSNVISIGHGLGAAPLTFGVLGTDSNAALVTNYTGFDANVINFQASFYNAFQPPNTTQTPFVWFAVG